MSTNEVCLQGELFPTEIRAVSAGIVNVTNHIPVVINMLTFPIITSAGLLHIAMYVYGAFAFLMAVWGIMTIKVWKILLKWYGLNKVIYPLMPNKGNR